MSAVPIFIEDLKKIYYPDKMVLHDIDLLVERGESIGILGRNGSGKTTLLRILATLIYASSGTVKIFDMDPRFSATRIKAMIGYLPERFAFYPYFKVEDVLNFFEKLTPMDRMDQEEVKEQTIRMLGIGSFLETKVHSLSKGMLHKVGLAITLIHDPPLLLLDEPTSGLDPLVRYQVRKILTKLRKSSSKTILISSHVLEDVETVCDRVFFLEEGSMVYWPFKISDMHRKLKRLQKLLIWTNEEINKTDLTELENFLYFSVDSTFIEVYCFDDQVNEVREIVTNQAKSYVDIQTHKINLEDIYILNDAKIDWIDFLE
ncbi:MAG: ABC transporter ATP-binding protein [Candidatus Thorarchaeota archaeon]